MEKSIFEYGGINDPYGDCMTANCPKVVEIDFKDGKKYHWIPSGKELDEMLELRDRNIKKSIHAYNKERELKLYKSLIVLL